MLEYFKRTVIVALAAALLLTPISVKAQPAIDILGAEIRLGAERSAVLPKFSAFRLQCFGEAAGVPISECKSILIQRNQPPYDTHAHLVFEGSRLKAIRKSWSREYQGTEPGNFVQTLYAVISSISLGSSTPFQVSTAERRDSGIVQQTIILSSGRRTITISYAEGLRGTSGTILPPFVNLDESIE